MEHGILVLDEDMKDSALMNNSSQNFDGSWIQSPQVNVFEALQTLPDLGLKLSKTSSFLNKLDQVVQQGYNFNVGEQANSSYNPTSKANSKDILQHANKMKAENFPISLLRIGSWQRVSKNEGDLVAKCYFAKRKLVWEFLENGLKSKIEIQWSDILSLKAVMQEDQYGILEIELNQPPSFHHEIDPQPRKHTQWRMVSDFTGGQAPTFRRHHLEFPPGALDRPLEKLLRCDNRLFQLSQQSYPTLKSPYFHKHTFGNDFSFDFGGQSHVNSQQQQFSYLSQHFQTYDHTTHNSLNFKDSNSPISVMDFSHIDEHDNNQMPFRDQVRGMPFNAALVNNHMPAYVQGMKNQLGGPVPTSSISQMYPIIAERHQSRYLQNMVFDNSQIEFSNRIMEGNLFVEGHPTNNTNNVIANYGLSNNLSSSSSVRSQIYPQVNNWSQSQVYQMPDNNSFCSSINSDPTMEHCISAHHFNHEINDWTHDFNHGHNDFV